MAKHWSLGAGLTAWLGVAAVAAAQSSPGAQLPMGPTPLPQMAQSPVAGSIPGAATMPGAGMPPGSLGPLGIGPPCPPSLGGPIGGPCIPDNSFSECDSCGCQTSWYLYPEYVLWWMKDRQLPALVTLGSTTDPVPGALFQPGTQVIVGGATDGFYANGGRFMGGFWFDPDHHAGIQASGFILEHRTRSYANSSNGAPGSLLLARPFIDSTTLAENASLISDPQVLAGVIGVSLPQRMLGAELNFLSTFSCCTLDSHRLRFLLGIRYLNLDEKVTITSQTFSGIAPSETITNVNENFTTYNRFYGGQVGSEFDWYLGPFLASVVGKIALGSVDQVLEVSGNTVITSPTGVTAYPNRGVLVGPNNAGRFKSRRFTFVPELDVNLAYQFNRNIAFRVGYTYLYWNDFLQPENQIDRVASSTPLVGVPPRPQSLFPRESNFWLQGLNLGLMFDF